jgi:hypothetical protein
MRTRLHLPRPEYPRPDRQRGFVHGVDWLNLNGAWEFRFDGARSGVEEGWHAPGGPRWGEQIIVPFCWESLAAWGEADAAGNDHYFSRRVYRDPLALDHGNYRDASRYEVGWYRRVVTVPDNEHWRGRQVILTIGAADFFTECWCNGRYLGRHEGGYIPSEWDITESLDAERLAWIVIRVEDPIDNREQPVGKQWGWYSSASGIWQTVFLEPRAPEWIERFEVVSDLDAATATITTYTRGGSRLHVEVTCPKGEMLQKEAEMDHGMARCVVHVAPLVLWDPNDPQLYRLRLTLQGQGPEDTVFGYFGMRSLTAQGVEEAGAPAALSLNGQPIYLRGALYQSYFPDGIYTAGDVQALIDDINYAKRVGFDMLRVHIKVDDPLLLYYADTLGILLMCDFPNFGEGGDTPLGRQRFENMMRKGIERDFNHPSIIAWCLFNETWGFGGQAEFVKLINPKPPLRNGIVIRPEGTKLANRESYYWVQAMWNLAKGLDPTRLVEDMSVVAWDHIEHYGHGGTDINSWHFYSHDYEKARAHIEEVVAETYAGSTFNYVSGFQQGTQPLINSEYGGIGALDGDRDISWSFKFLTNELRRHGKLSAYIFTELHDVEWERNGFLNYDRTPKDFGYDPRLVNAGDVLPIDAPPIARCAPGEERAIDVYSSHFSRRPREAVSLHWRLSGIDSLGWMHDDLASGVTPIPFRHHRVELAQRIALRMPTITMLCTLWVRAMTPDGSTVARNYVQFFVNGGWPECEQIGDSLILRTEATAIKEAHWVDPPTYADEAARQPWVRGRMHGWFEWSLRADRKLEGFRRLRVLCEASACREEPAQTDSFARPTTLRLLLNGVRIDECILPNHPHDARGALSYLHGEFGAYGYLISATVDGELLESVLSAMNDTSFSLRCEVPAEALQTGGLTIYSGESGRFPIPPTIILQRT